MERRMIDDVKEWGLVLVIALVVLFTLFCFFGGIGIFVADDSVAVRALETQGMSNVKVVDHAYFFVPMRGGSDNDRIRYDCEATNASGQKVKMYVFTGLFFKGATVRTF